jgi:hypothetical protein
MVKTDTSPATSAFQIPITLKAAALPASATDDIFCET